MSETGTLKAWIDETLRAQLAPEALEVIDESHLHAGHSGARPEGETPLDDLVLDRLPEALGLVHRSSHRRFPADPYSGALTKYAR